MRPFVSYYQKDKVIPMIIDVFKKESIKINSDIIKVWSCDYMRVNDVLRGVQYAKSINSDIIIYTNTVPLKSKITSDYKVKIYDIEDLRNLAQKHSDYNLYDAL